METMAVPSLGYGWCLKHSSSLVVWFSCKFMSCFFVQGKTLRSNWTGCSSPRTALLHLLHLPLLPPPAAAQHQPPAPPHPAAHTAVPAAAGGGWRWAPVHVLILPVVWVLRASPVPTLPPFPTPQLGPGPGTPLASAGWHFWFSHHGVWTFGSCVPPRRYDGRVWWWPHSSSSSGAWLKNGLFISDSVTRKFCVSLLLIIKQFF